MLAAIERMRGVQENLAAAGSDELAVIGKRVRAAVDALEEATHWIVGRQREEPRAVLAGAGPFLELAGIVCGGVELGRGSARGGTATRGRRRRCRFPAREDCDVASLCRTLPDEGSGLRDTDRRRRRKACSRSPRRSSDGARRSIHRGASISMNEHQLNADDPDRPGPARPRAGALADAASSRSSRTRSPCRGWSRPGQAVVRGVGCRARQVARGDRRTRDPRRAQRGRDDRRALGAAASATDRGRAACGTARLRVAAARRLSDAAGPARQRVVADAARRAAVPDASSAASTNDPLGPLRAHRGARRGPGAASSSIWATSAISIPRPATANGRRRRSSSASSRTRARARDDSSVVGSGDWPPVAVGAGASTSTGRGFCSPSSSRSRRRSSPITGADRRCSTRFCSAWRSTPSPPREGESRRRLRRAAHPALRRGAARRADHRRADRRPRLVQRRADCWRRGRHDRRRLGARPDAGAFAQDRHPDRRRHGDLRRIGGNCDRRGPAAQRDLGARADLHDRRRDRALDDRDDSLPGDRRMGGPRPAPGRHLPRRDDPRRRPGRRRRLQHLARGRRLRGAHQDAARRLPAAGRHGDFASSCVTASVATTSSAATIRCCRPFCSPSSPSSSPEASAGSRSPWAPR